MPDFNWKERMGSSWADRFPDWAIGLWVWREYGYRIVDGGGNRILETLSGLWDESDIRRTIKCPRLFISHKQCDEALAKRIAWIAKDQGFDYWLDVEDPTLTSLKEGDTSDDNTTMVATIIACVIEMALLNCTHVAAVISPSTKDSRWVPYEFGRVKDNRLMSLRAGSWIHPDVAGKTLPEYLHLCKVMHDKRELPEWLSLEKSSWTKQHGLCHKGSQSLWVGPEPEDLPGE